MKKLMFYSFILLMSGVSIPFSSCSEDSENAPVVTPSEVNVSVSAESILFGPESSTFELTVTADVDWAIRTASDWIIIRPSGGLKNKATVLQLSVNANSGMEERAADLEIVAGGSILKTISVKQGYVMKAAASVSSLVLGAQESTATFNVNANGEWTLSSEEPWVTINPSQGIAGDTSVEVKASANSSSYERTALLTLTCGESRSEIRVTQLSDAIVTPAGYQLVWDDEFNGGAEPGKDWVLENWPAGYVNNELQIYTSKKIDGKSTVEIKDGFLNITCFKASDGKIYSGRMNACPSTGWLYGYFEARILLPKGRGTWPAFWMMPSNVDWGKNPWPICGEIDIMEEVGANPEYVSSSLHTEKYNHTKGTQITHEMKCPGAEDSFHVYALEWTPDEIITYVDGKVQLRATKAALGEDHDCWPFHYPFYPILNLAWGGDWGGYKGVDVNALPVTMKVDYVRIFQKK